PTSGLTSGPVTTSCWRRSPPCTRPSRGWPAAPTRWAPSNFWSNCSPTTRRCAPQAALPWPGRWSPAHRGGRPPARSRRAAPARCCVCAGWAGVATAPCCRRPRTLPRRRYSWCPPSRSPCRGSPSWNACSTSEAADGRSPRAHVHALCHSVTKAFAEKFSRLRGEDMSSSDTQAGSKTGTAQIGVTGLAVMGSNIARNFAHHGYTVALHNRSIAKTDALLSDHGSEGKFVRSETIAEFLDALEKPRRVLIMVKAGDPTDAVINELADAMEEGDIIIDGGNALYTDTIRREKAMRERGLHFVGAGISGGEEGALNGPSIMPGGPAESYKSLGPLLEEISAHVDGVPCCTHIGPDGAGHFVKMVHNGIEYSDMQLIGEAYQLLRDALGKTAGEIADVFDEWNTGDLDSFLVEITAQVLRQTDAKTGKPLVDVILDEAEQKGTGRWTVKSALDLGVPVTGIAEAVFARALSGSVSQRR